MSKIKLEGNASGSGTLTISAPNTNTDRSLTLPDGAGEILTDASTLSSSNLSGALPALDGSALTGITSQTVAYWQPSADSIMNTADTNYITNWTEVRKSGLTMSHSSGLFTFPETGIYKIECLLSLAAGSTDHRWVGLMIEDADQNNVFQGDGSFKYQSVTTYHQVGLQAIANITNTSSNSQKYKFNVRKTNSNDMNVRSATNLIFTRIGDSV